MLVDVPDLSINQSASLPPYRAYNYETIIFPSPNPQYHQLIEELKAVK